MPSATRTENSRTHPRDSSAVSVLSGWTQQGVQSFFAMQRILLDLAMRQNRNVMHAPRQQPTDPHHSPTTILSEVAAEGMTNFIEGQEVLLDLGKQLNEILMDVMVEETASATGAKKGNGAVKKIKKTELSELVRKATESFNDAEKKLADVAGKQMNANVKTAGKSLELLRPFPSLSVAELTRGGVKSYVDAQKALTDVMGKTPGANQPRANVAPEEARSPWRPRHMPDARSC
jgi:hypothetical protein